MEEIQFLTFELKGMATSSLKAKLKLIKNRIYLFLNKNFYS